MRSSQPRTRTAGRAAPAVPAEARARRRVRRPARRCLGRDRRADPRHQRAGQAADGQRRPRRGRLRRRPRPRDGRRLRPRRPRLRGRHAGGLARPVLQHRERAPDGGRARLGRVRQEGRRRLPGRPRLQRRRAQHRLRSLAQRGPHVDARLPQGPDPARERPGRRLRPPPRRLARGLARLLQLELLDLGQPLERRQPLGRADQGGQHEPRPRPGQGMDRVRRLAAEPALRDLLPQLQRRHQRAGRRAGLDRRRPHLVDGDHGSGLPRARIRSRRLRSRSAAARAAERARADPVLRREQALDPDLRRRRTDVVGAGRDRAVVLPLAPRPPRRAAPDVRILAPRMSLVWARKCTQSSRSSIWIGSSTHNKLHSSTPRMY